ncbi:MAG: hypothetical protein FWD69_10550 [Polyangiaceae bacterium]|nr:hypothetical protein [Polyangiaceae bacterium]
MTNNVRFIIAVIATGLLAMLATPEIAGKLPSGIAQAIAVGIAAALHRMDAEAPDSPSDSQKGGAA